MSWEALSSVDGFGNLNKEDLVYRQENSGKMRAAFQAAIAEEPGMKQNWFKLSAKEYQSWETIEMPKIWESTKA